MAFAMRSLKIRWCVLTCACCFLIALASVQAQEDIENSENATETGVEEEEVQEKLEQLANLAKLKELLLGMLQRAEEEEADTKKQPKSKQKYIEDEGEREEEEEEQTSYNPYRDNFYDRFDDGTYVYGYSLPNGVRRYERTKYSDKYKGLVTEGFYAEPRHYGVRVMYELRCYRADYYGYRPLKVQYLNRPPVVQRDRLPTVDCFND